MCNELIGSVHDFASICFLFGGKLLFTDQKLTEVRKTGEAALPKRVH